jgi:hypothetical protein
MQPFFNFLFLHFHLIFPHFRVSGMLFLWHF